MKILLRLKSTMQSWGDESNETTKGSTRKSYPIPTYSGVIGMICSCMGINRKNDSDKYEEVLSNVSYTHAMSKKSFSVMSDYQTMGGGYDTTNKIQKKMVPAKSDGKFISISKNEAGISNSKLSTRDYLVDSDFFIILDVNDSFVDKVIENIKNPVWTPVLGRSCCIPTERLFVCCDTDVNTLIAKTKQILNKEQLLLYSTVRPSNNHSAIEMFDMPDKKVQFKYYKRIVFKSMV